MVYTCNTRVGEYFSRGKKNFWGSRADREDTQIEFWRILESFVWLEIWLKAAVIGDIGNKGLNLPPFIGKPEKRTI